MPDFHVFTLFVAFHAVLLTLLALNVVRLRISQRIPNGDGNSVPLKKAIRAHANAVEQVILFALVLLALTYQAKSPELLMLLAGSFCAVRLVHALGMLQPHRLARQLGAGLTFALQIAGAALLVL
ncbi:MAG: MAPEG family protein [Pseudomonadota bacterium]